MGNSRTGRIMDTIFNGYGVIAALGVTLIATDSNFSDSVVTVLSVVYIVVSLLIKLAKAINDGTVAELAKKLFKANKQAKEEDDGESREE